ncbi:MAG: ATP-binding protein [Streptosporangiaceae bacterium]
MVTRQAPAAAAAETLVRTLPGAAAQAAAARRWARAAVGEMAGPDVADLAEMAVSELLANAVQHSRSGQPGGTVTVIIAGGADGLTVHVHDLGAVRGTVPRPRHPAGQSDGLAESGRGLLIVAALSQASGSGPARDCQHAQASGPVAVADGGCAWFRLAGPADRQAAR